MLKLFVISKNNERVLNSLQPMAPFLQCQLHCQKLSVPSVIIMVSREQAAGQEGTWVNVVVSLGITDNQVLEASTSTIELSGRVSENQDWCLNKPSLQVFECCLGFRAQSKLNFYGGQLVQRTGN